MKLQTLVLPFSIVVLAIGLLVFSFMRQPAVQTYGASFGVDTISAATTSAAVQVTTTTRVLATTTNPLDPSNSYQRVYASICNYSNVAVWLRLDSDKPVTGTTTALVAIAASSTATSIPQCYIIGDDFVYHGSVTASTTNGVNSPVSVQVTQYVRQ